ncbi:hypothetical protein BJV78DRAFT_1158197 [Lactifluus subvellereus]|nr:hypothetical protein BJV78DRAFT_1158197 [Lactifluus subvellereus]
MCSKPQLEAQSEARLKPPRSSTLTVLDHRHTVVPFRPERNPDYSPLVERTFGHLRTSTITSGYARSGHRKRYWLTGNSDYFLVCPDVRVIRKSTICSRVLSLVWKSNRSLAALMEDVRWAISDVYGRVAAIPGVLQLDTTDPQNRMSTKAYRDDRRWTPPIEAAVVWAFSLAILAVAAPQPQEGLGADLNGLLENLGETVDDLLSGEPGPLKFILREWDVWPLTASGAVKGFSSSYKCVRSLADSRE